MSTDPLLDKMDALLKKHRVVEAPAAKVVSQTAPSAPPPLPDDAWLPVLTDVVALGEVNTTPAIAEPSAPPPPSPPLPSIDPEAILSELEPRLSALIQGAVAEEIRNSLDNALATLLVQLDVHVREIVRETINEKLGK